MAGVSGKEIKNRIRSMESTMQITKAMEMVAASKLRRAQEKVLRSRPYYETIYATMQRIASSGSDFSSPYLDARPVKKVAWVVIAGDRGLAGGYNSNIFKLVQSKLQPETSVVVPIGKKAAEYFKTMKTPMLTDHYTEAERIGVGDCFTIGKQLCTAYLKGEFDEVWIGYTDFDSLLSQTPAVKRILPIQCEAASSNSGAEVVYEPGGEEVFAAIVPEFVGGVIYGALCEGRASEQAARRSAMDSATQNAEEMIADLSLKYNRARQAAITQEITEIVAGS